MPCQFSWRSLELVKRYPLAISRGVSTGSINLLVAVQDENGRVGLGEAAPDGRHGWTLERIEAEVTAFTRDGLDWEAIRNVYVAMKESGMCPPAMSAIDCALWDLRARQANMPLHRLLGAPRPSVPTSVTIGINPPEVVRERVPEILTRTGARFLKVKLGSPEGVGADKAMYAACQDAAHGFPVSLRVDANGGWSLPDARMMCAWLAERGADYVEQPLAEGREAEMSALFEGRPLPLFLDESCRMAPDVVALADRVDGVNLKLMKCGGITGALDIIATARAHGLQVMIGCMGESSIGIASGVAVSGLVDHIDLDAQLNLLPDPASGLVMTDGVVTPVAGVCGHGGVIVSA